MTDTPRNMVRSTEGATQTMNFAVKPDELPQPKPEPLDAQVWLNVASEICLEIEADVAAFWSIPLPVHFFSVADNPHYFWHMQDFYVAQKGLDDEGKRWAQLRISEGLCQTIFETTLGKSSTQNEFSLAHVQNFEVFLLERFSRVLFQTLSSRFIKSPSKTAPRPEHDPLVHFVWVLGEKHGPSLQADQACHLVLTLPQSCLKKPPADDAPPPVFRPTEETFAHAHAVVNIRAGLTRATLEDLQRLESGDWVVFENSDVTRWQVENPANGQWVSFAVTVPDDRKHPDLMSQQGNVAMPTETTTKPTIWDNLEVEVAAAFTAIKLPLKQLKEMEQGLVIEVGDLMDNKIHIQVEGHPVAWGELLVLGDKFAVRIQGLNEAVHQVDQHSPAVSPVAEQPAENQTASASQNNEANSGDDLMDLDLNEDDFDDLDEEWS